MVSSDEERLLSIAALFEGDFSLDWVEDLTGARASAILSALEGAVEKGWLSQKRPAVYSYKDETRRREQARTLSLGEIERLHREIADILVRELPDSDSSVLQVSHHLLHVPVDWKGCLWLMRAGRIHVESLSADRAIACFEHVLTALSVRRGDSEDRLFIEAAMEHSNVFAGRSEIGRSVAFLSEARLRAMRLADKRPEILLEMHLAKYERLGSDFNTALRRFERAFARAAALGDADFLAATTMFHTYFLFWQGRFKDVIDVYERFVPDVDRYPVGHFPLIAAMMVGHCLGMTGQATQGLGLLDAIRNHCLERGDLYLSSHAAASIAMVMICANRLDETVAYARKGLREAEKSNNRWVRTITTLLLALACHYQGDAKAATRHLRSFQRHRGAVHSGSVLIPYVLEACWAMESGKLKALPDLSLNDEVDGALAQRNVFLKGLAFRYKALKGLREGRPVAEMGRLLTLSANHLKTAGNSMELGKTYLELARVQLSAGDDRKGRASVRMASEILSPISVDVIPDDLKALAGEEHGEGSILSELLSLGRHAGSGADSGKVFQWVVSTANRIVGAERAALLLEGTTGSRGLQLRASKNLTREEIEEPGFADSLETIREVMTSGKGRITQSLRGGGGAAHSSPMVRSRICVPLVVNGRTAGVLYHENRLLNNLFTERHLELLAFFAAVAALNLDRETIRLESDTRASEDSRTEISHRPEDTGEGLREGIVAASSIMRQVLHQAEDMARTDAPVLILGETGVGKNLVAAEIHQRSVRRDGPFITVQCSALTESLITSELFGHEKGAFTGATDRQIGRFELASGGTLFLDEIGDLSLDVQSRLLRVLQTREFERVGGGRKTLTSDFRLIAATNRDLTEEIRLKRFREDLFYRINVLPLLIPPLRERKEDIPPLVHRIMATHAAALGTGVKRISREVMDSLCAHEWPGNVRELENVIQRGLLASNGSGLQLPPLTPPGGGQDNNRGLKRLDQAERDHILQALEARGWRIRGPHGAAEVLGINPSTLRSRMKKLGIERHHRREPL